MHEARPQALLPVLFLSLSLISRPLFFPFVEQHPQQSAAGNHHQADPQRHIAAVPGLGAFCLPRRLALLFGFGWVGWVSRVSGVCRGLSGWSGQSAQPDRWDLLE